MTSLVEIGPVILEKKILKFCQIECIFVISLLSSIWNGQNPSFDQNLNPVWLRWAKNYYWPEIIIVHVSIYFSLFLLAIRVSWQQLLGYGTSTKLLVGCLYFLHFFLNYTCAYIRWLDYINMLILCFRSRESVKVVQINETPIKHFWLL